MRKNKAVEKSRGTSGVVMNPYKWFNGSEMKKRKNAKRKVELFSLGFLTILKISKNERIWIKILKKRTPRIPEEIKLDR